MKISIHIHSEYSSDSRQPVATIVEESRERGYDAIAITDHNTVAGSMAALEMRPDNLSVITGAEFSTDKGHILALFIDDTIEKSCRMTDFGCGRIFDFNDLVSRVRDQGGLLFLAHPLQSAATQDHSFIRRLDGYELINGRINSGNKDKRSRHLSKELAEAYPDKVRVGGSDAHIRAEIKSVYMTAASGDLKKALTEPESICFKKSSMAQIRFHNMKNHKRKRLKYYCRQSAAMLYGFFYDLGSRLKGDTHEIIRVRKESR